MGTHARIEFDHITIDSTAWLGQRTGGPLDDLTHDLRTWAAAAVPCAHSVDSAATARWQQAVLDWCSARGYFSPEPCAAPKAGPTVLTHEGTRLDTDLWIARAIAGRWGPVAVVLPLVSTRHDTIAPVVYADTATDSGYWYDADTVEIGCPRGHGWLLRTGREMVTACGDFATVTTVFGLGLDAPFTRCPDCAAVEQGHRDQLCGCDRSAWILCPTCGTRCDVELPSL
jgi:hypothetical protein